MTPVLCVYSRSKILTNVLQPGEPTCRDGELVAEVRAGSSDKIQQHKQILEERKKWGEVGAVGGGFALMRNTS